MKCEDCVFFTPKKQVGNVYKSWCSLQKIQKEVAKDDSSCAHLVISSKAKKSLEEKKIGIRKLEKRKKEEIKIFHRQIFHQAKSFDYHAELSQKGILIATKQDHWLLETSEDGILLFHRNKKGDTSKYHKQHDFHHKDVESLFDFFKWHDRFSREREINEKNLKKIKFRWSRDAAKNINQKKNPFKSVQKDINALVSICPVLKKQVWSLEIINRWSSGYNNFLQGASNWFVLQQGKKDINRILNYIKKD